MTRVKYPEHKRTSKGETMEQIKNDVRMCLRVSVGVCVCVCNCMWVTICVSVFVWLCLRVCGHVSVRAYVGT